MLPKRLLALTLFAALATMHAGALRAQWVQCNGPSGGTVNALASMDPYVFATTSGGLYRSTNNGRSWALVQSGIADNPGIAIDGKTIYFASDRLYVSEDSGTTWTVLDSLPCSAGQLAVMGRYLYLCSFEGLYRTLDRGQTWESIGDFFNKAILVKDGNLYVGRMSSGLYQSSDSGSTWTLIEGNSNSIMDGASIEALTFAGDDIFAGGYYAEGFFRSTDNGVTWDTSDNGLPNAHFSNGIEDNFPTIFGLYLDGHKLFAAAADGIYLSLDSGASWSQISSQPAQTIVRSGGNLLAGTWDVGILLSSDDGATWHPSSDDMQNTNVTSMTSIGTHLFAATYGSGVWSSNDSGTTWNLLDSPLAPPSADGFVTIDTTLFVFSGFELFTSHDYGITWDTIRIPGYWPAASIGSALVSNRDQTMLLSTDQGATWEPRGTVLGNALACLTQISGVLYSGSGDEGYDVSASTDSGLTWKIIPLPQDDYGTNINSICPAGNYLFAATGANIDWPGFGILRKANSDTSFSFANGNLPDLSNMAAASIVSIDSTIFLGTQPAGAIGPGEQSPGIFSSSDFGTSWQTHNEGLVDLNTNVLLVFPPYIFDGTQSAGLWRRPLSEMTGQSAVRDVERDTASISIYPNPFSESTTITFTPEASCYADVSIVNLLGVEVAHLFSGELAAGEHSFAWGKPAGLPDGMYECLVRMNGRVETLPVVLAR